MATLATDALSRKLERIGDNPDAAVAAHRLRGHDPLYEAAHRRLMQLDAARGMRGAVRARYGGLTAALRRDLGTEPAPEARALSDRLRRGSSATSPAPVPVRVDAASDTPRTGAPVLLLCMKADGAPDFATVRNTALTLLADLQFAVAFVSVRSRRFARLVRPEPTLLLRKGAFLPEAMRRARVTQDELVSV